MPGAFSSITLKTFQIRAPHGKPAPRRRLAWSVLAMVFAVSLGAGAAVEKRLDSFEQKIPLAVVQPGETKAACIQLGLKWNPDTQPGPHAPVTFQVNSEAPADSKMNLRSQGWIAALCSAMAWQEPWSHARWEMQSAPPMDEGVSAGLGVGMVGTAAGVEHPLDTVVIGSLNPDGSLGPVSGIQERIDAASRAKYRRIVIPFQQRVEKSPYGNMVNMESHARGLGLECLPAKDLAEAIHHVLKIRLSDVPLLESPPLPGPALSEFLEKECRKEMDRLGKLEASGRSADRAVEAARERAEHQKKAGMTAYRAGQFYAALLRFKRASAEVAAADGLEKEKSGREARLKSELAGFQQATVSMLAEAGADRNDVSSALALAERNDWIFQLQARIEGALAIAGQALPADSDATEEYKTIARERLAETAAYARSMLEDREFYSRLGRQLPGHGGAGPANRPDLWVSHLLEAHLGSAELLGYQLKESATALRESLLLDPRLVAQAKLLGQLRNQRRKLDMEEQQLKDLDVRRVGFTPGSSYRPPEPPGPPLPTLKMSDTARSVLWANDYCEIAALAAKYRKLGGRYDTVKRAWVIGNPGALESMLIQAEIGARRGIALAQKAGVDPTMLCLIYEHAASLRVDESEHERLEALRHYWRCALMGNLAWQLQTQPQEPPQKPAPVSAEAAPPQPPAPAPEPKPADVTPARARSPESQRPHSVPAIPVSEEELEDDMEYWREQWYD